MQFASVRKRIRAVCASRLIERLYHALLILAIVAGLFGSTSRAAPDGPGEAIAPLVFLAPTQRRLSAFPQGIAGMMADYVPDYGVIYLIGGYRSGSTAGTKVISRDIWRYDPDFDKLTRIDELSDGLALAAHAYVPAEGLIYLFGGVQESTGGVNGSTASRTYHVATGDVETLSASLPAPRARASAVYVPQDNKIYIVGGTATSVPDQQHRRL